MKLHELLRMRRLENELTQEQLADQLFVTHQSVSKWENGTNIPSLENLLAMGDLYNISLDELVRGHAFFRKPFLVGKRLTKSRLISCILIALFFTKFFASLILPWYVAIAIMVLMIVTAITGEYEMYWIIENDEIAVRQYKKGLKKFFELIGEAFGKSRKRRILYKEIEILQIVYVKRKLFSPMDINGDYFYLLLNLKDKEIIKLVITPELTEFLPQFISFIQKKGILVKDTKDIVSAVRQKENIYEYVHENF